MSALTAALATAAALLRGESTLQQQRVWAGEPDLFVGAKPCLQADNIRLDG
jgi:hypothetical protein